MADHFGHLNEIHVLLEKSEPKCTEKALKFGIKVFDDK